MTNLESEKELKVLRANKDKLFERKPTSNKYFKKVLLGERDPYNYRSDIIDNIDSVSTDGYFMEESFSDYVSDLIKNSDYKLSEIAKETNIEKEALYNLLDGERFPWSMSKESIIRLFSIINIPIIEGVELLQSVEITPDKVTDNMPVHYAARSLTGISSSDLKSSVSDANIKIGIEREKEKRDQFIKNLLDKSI